MTTAAAVSVWVSTHHHLSYSNMVCVKVQYFDSLSLFQLVMDPLLRQLEQASIGLSVNWFAGGFLHRYKQLDISRKAVLYIPF